MAAVLIINGGARIPEAAVAPEAGPGRHGEGDKDRSTWRQNRYSLYSYFGAQLLSDWCTAAFQLVHPHVYYVLNVD